MTQTDLIADLHALLVLAQQHVPVRSGELLSTRLSQYLDQPVTSVAVLTEDIPAHRYVDFDIALEMLARRDPQAEVIGVGGGDMRYHNSLSDILQSEWGAGVPVAQPDLTVLPDSPTTERNCLGHGIRLFRHQGVPVAVLERETNPRRGSDLGSLEVLCPDRELARALLKELRELSLSHSVLRGQVVSFRDSGYDSTARGITFVARPTIAEADVVLPAGTLSRIKAHVLGIAEHSEQLRNHGQHLKRGVLLYGPPGTGKTHTLRHLIGQATNHTIVLLSGTSLGMVGLAAHIARAMQPAIVVLEDVDLVAQSRDFSHGAQPLLFEVMDAMDGLDGDADVTFLLTTNRVEAMEQALTQRPGRVDLAAEIPLPDQPGRAALLRLYSPQGCFTQTTLDEVASRLVCTTASLAKELVRRAVLQATIDGVEPTDEHLLSATEHLLDASEQLSRVLLGAQRDAAEWAGPVPDDEDAGWLGDPDCPSDE